MNTTQTYPLAAFDTDRRDALADAAAVHLAVSDAERARRVERLTARAAAAGWDVTAAQIAAAIDAAIWLEANATATVGTIIPFPTLTDGPEPPPPAAPAVIPLRQAQGRLFDRTAHCQRIGAGGGAATLAKFGRQHYRGLGKAGAKATITKHGLAYWKGLPSVKRWSPSRPDLAADLAAGAYLADLAA